ncbi:unnamed protein product [Pleuronectes platessa]|uniref:Uncharacterized protein n=1 Tax=Pleuronectes platessa TaxID=8262 RepID=A0A9N7YG97_PLEPL|nr:unnamed protein product [Pleuronectes platessa]
MKAAQRSQLPVLTESCRQHTDRGDNICHRGHDGCVTLDPAVPSYPSSAVSLVVPRHKSPLQASSIKASPPVQPRSGGFAHFLTSSGPVGCKRFSLAASRSVSGVLITDKSSRLCGGDPAWRQHAAEARAAEVAFRAPLAMTVLTPAVHTRPSSTCLRSCHMQARGGLHATAKRVFGELVHAVMKTVVFEETRVERPRRDLLTTSEDTRLTCRVLLSAPSSGILQGCVGFILFEQEEAGTRRPSFFTALVSVVECRGFHTVQTGAKPVSSSTEGYSSITDDLAGNSK